MIALPALHRPEWFKFTVGLLFGEDERDQLKLPDEPTIRKEEESMWTKFTTQLKYVKLHGSFGWLSQTGSDAMIIGYGKYGAISKEPLLKWYLSLFERVLNSGERKLLVTGYSFRDEHINKIIVKAIRDSGLKCSSCPQEHRSILEVSYFPHRNRGFIQQNSGTHYLVISRVLSMTFIR